MVCMDQVAFVTKGGNHIGIELVFYFYFIKKRWLGMRGLGEEGGERERKTGREKKGEVV